VGWYHVEFRATACFANADFWNAGAPGRCAPSAITNRKFD
jgi:hypothetical protein